MKMQDVSGILYTFRRCPYCMRAHMALKNSGLKIELREVKLSDIPEEALAASSDKTVPVLILPDGEIMTESWDIVKWALRNKDPDNWQGENGAFIQEAEMLIELNDFSFKDDLDHYKYADRYPEHSELYYRQACEEFIEEIEDMLLQHKYLISDQVSIADIAVFPFIRQFSYVDRDWFDQSDYKHVQSWLNDLINSPLFQQVFQKHAIWKSGDTAVYL